MIPVHRKGVSRFLGSTYYLKIVYKSVPGLFLYVPIDNTLTHTFDRNLPAFRDPKSHMFRIAS